MYKILKTPFPTLLNVFHKRFKHIMRPGLISVVGLGNPMLDILVILKSDEFLKKYNLIEDNKYVVEEGIMGKMKDDLQTYLEHPALLAPGGSVQNTLRVLEWALQRPKITAIIGMVGMDDYGDFLKKSVNDQGVLTRYRVHEKRPTGTILAISYKKHTVPIACTGAENLTLNHIKEELESPIFENSYIVYLGGFILVKTKPELAKYLVSFCEQKNKILAFNTSSCNIINVTTENTIFLANNCEFLFGNRQEMGCLAQAMGYKRSIEDLCIQLSKEFKRKPLSNFGKVVVFTDGGTEIFCAYSNGKHIRFPVPPLDKRFIKDTTGAGDAFVAGFFCGLLKDKPIEICLNWGLWTSQHIIQTIAVSQLRFQSYIEDVGVIAI